MRFIHLAALVTMAMGFCSCQRVDDVVGTYRFGGASNAISPTEFVNQGHWDAAGAATATGDRCIVVDTALQQVSYYIGNSKVGFSTCSSGRAGHGTPGGTFKVLAKDATHKSSTYGSVVDAAGNTLISSYTAGQPMPAGGRYKGAEMNNALKLTNDGIWMHEGLVTAAPESHGCIRLPKRMAKIFFDNTPVGTKVIIR